jgi:hypothetical protein
MSDRRDDATADDQSDVIWPPPAKHEVEKAGGVPLPGFENVPERPAERRGHWQ